MAIDVFGPGSNRQQRILINHSDLAAIIAYQRQFHPDRKIVMTSGVFDLTHIGHGRYLEEAAKFGHILIVSLDCDEAVRIRKGKDRPVVPQDERAEMLCHLRHVDLVVFDTDFQENGHTKLSLVEMIKPDVFVASERSFSEEQLAQIRECAKELHVLPSQAETSTSAKVRKLVIGPWLELGSSLQGIEEQLGKLRESVQRNTANG